MMIKSPRTRQSLYVRRRLDSMTGFTMVEVLVAMTVLTVAFMGMITVLLAGQGDISQSGRDTAAAVAAQSLVENMRNMRQADLPLLDGMTTDNPANCPGAGGSYINTLCTNWIAQVSALPQGRGTVAVAQIPNAIVFNQITVTVTWAEVGRGGRQLTMVAGVAAPPF